MFDISFSELMVIAIVALIVIGPEKLPKVARTAGAFFGRMQRFVTQVKDEVNREARFAELQHLQEEVKSSLQQGVQDIEQSILPSASVPPTAAQAVTMTQAITIEGETTPAKKPRKPRAKKLPQAIENTSTEVAESKPSRRRKSPTSASEALRVAAAAEADAAEKAVVATKPRAPRKPRVAKPNVETSS